MKKSSNNGELYPLNVMSEIIVEARMVKVTTTYGPGVVSVNYYPWEFWVDSYNKISEILRKDSSGIQELKKRLHLPGGGFKDVGKD